MKSITGGLSNGKPGGEYPERPKFYCLKFVRALANSRAANEIGAAGCWLLAIIAFQEDEVGYRPITFWNSQLVPLTGFGSVSKLRRVRARAVAAGWLHYQPGRKGRAGVYWTTTPPALNPVLWRTGRAQSGSVCGAPVEHKPTGKWCAKRPESVTPSSLLPNPTQRARSASDEEPAEFAAFWSSYPVKQSREEALATWLELDPGPELVERIMVALAAAIRSPEWNREKGKSRPYPARWLRERRWLDHAGATAQANGNGDVDGIAATLRWRDRAAEEKAAALSGIEIRDLLAKRWKAPPAANGSA
jgi:hypothetical protein